MSENKRLFKNVKSLCVCAMLTSLAIVIGWICKLYLTFDVFGGSVRITFENMPIILAGLSYGPVAGATVGLCADFVGTAISQYGVGGINPLITLGSLCVGLASGIVGKTMRKGKARIGLSVTTAHLFGSVIIKSLGLYFYHYYVEIVISGISVNSLLLRIPTYIIIGTAEYFIIVLISKNKFIANTLRL